MSTDSTHPTDPAPAGPATGFPATTTGLITTDPGGAPDAAPPEEREPGWVARNTTLLTTVLVAVIVVAVAIAGLVYYRDRIDRANTATEAAVAQSVAAQGATVETVECSGDTCAAVIGGQAYTVLVQEDGRGQRHFGVSAYAGD
ncbi:hypothetical protein SAMN05661080_03032 [Modestobacter sp. DSM 44400]|uniref:hypothetical protein n=1 Tax=Modestobacter sp. DSM 44400 TaxID=1550230 RepID=UPI000898B521|nr:hypothetical protein [Modestobacter sp. DSM 44400]SDY30767.1 hypothetical protein SAMN05661080_03032 [Modestobacter sp. DSM 44400]